MSTEAKPAEGNQPAPNAQATPSPAADKPPEQKAAPGVDVEKYAALEKELAKARKELETQSKRHAEVSSVVEKMKAAFGGDDKKDPAAIAAELQQSNAALQQSASRFQTLAARNAIFAEVVRAAAAEEAEDAEDVFRFVEDGQFEFDPESGRLKDRDAVRSWVGELLNKKPYLRKAKATEPEKPKGGQPLPGARPPRPTPPDASEASNPVLSAMDWLRGPKSALAKASKQ